jgi:hypothetical protein
MFEPTGPPICLPVCLPIACHEPLPFHLRAASCCFFVLSGRRRLTPTHNRVLQPSPEASPVAAIHHGGIAGPSSIGKCATSATLDSTGPGPRTRPKYPRQADKTPRHSIVYRYTMLAEDSSHF